MFPQIRKASIPLVASPGDHLFFHVKGEPEELVMYGRLRHSLMRNVKWKVRHCHGGTDFHVEVATGLSKRYGTEYQLALIFPEVSLLGTDYMEAFRQARDVWDHLRGEKSEEPVDPTSSAEPRRAFDDYMSLATQLRNGGQWLGAARSWMQSNVPRGDTLTWGSGELVTIPFCRLEELAFKVALAAVAEDRKTRAVGTGDGPKPG